MSLDDKSKLQKMVDMLRSGATMLPDVCPVCSTPLFKLKSGEIFCSGCNKRVLIVKEGEEGVKATQLYISTELNRVILNKILEIGEGIKEEADPSRLYDLAKCLLAYLEALERLKRVS